MVDDLSRPSWQDDWRSVLQADDGGLKIDESDFPAGKEMFSTSQIISFPSKFARCKTEFLDFLPQK